MTSVTAIQSFKRYNKIRTNKTDAVFFMSRIYGSPLTKVALMIRIWYHVPNSKRIYVLFFAIPIKNLCLSRSRDAQKLGTVIREIDIMYLKNNSTFKILNQPPKHSPMKNETYMISPSRLPTFKRFTTQIHPSKIP